MLPNFDQEFLPIFELLCMDHDYLVREAACGALAEMMKTAKFTDLFYKVLQDPNPYVIQSLL